MAEDAFDALLALETAAREHAEAEVASVADPSACDARSVAVRVATRVLHLPLAHVREVRRCPALAPMPGAHAWLAGAIAWQGRAVAVVDLARFAFDTDGERGATLLVCTDGDTVVGLRVDGVVDKQAAANGVQTAASTGTGDDDGRSFDVTALLADPRLLQAGRWPRARRDTPGAATGEQADDR